ncbi:MAG: hypothetical protein HY012_06570 [Acidobacteria bacterium]|nr:hypothetical protein [Acidobacteriota bacterium]
MQVLTIRRIAFGGAALFLFVQAAQAFRQAGFTQQAAFPAAIGALFAVMAIWGKSG